jgi:hypothetical protein
MLAASERRILETLGPDDLVLDVGGGWEPFPRADWVLDLLEHRPGSRATPETWVRRDICDREPWPFGDDRFDFAVCSHTLEDVRDPVWVCAELSRVARRGYVEVPSRLMEQAFGIQGPWVGYGHHHWLCEVVDGALQFVFKSHVLNGQPLFQLTAEDYWSASEEARVHAVFWEGEIRASERIFIGHEEHDAYVADLGRHRRA